jgi:hypothetical protein
LKCKNCGTDISSDLAKEVSDTVIKNMPNPQPQIQVKEKIVPQYPPEMKLLWCPDCHTHHTILPTRNQLRSVMIVMLNWIALGIGVYSVVVKTLKKIIHGDNDESV